MADKLAAEIVAAYNEEGSCIQKERRYAQDGRGK
jgi:ribosomal protein S7